MKQDIAIVLSIYFAVFFFVLALIMVLLLAMQKKRYLSRFIYGDTFINNSEQYRWINKWSLQKEIFFKDNGLDSFNDSNYFMQKMSRSNNFGWSILVFFKSIYHFLSFVMFFFISWNISYYNDFIVIYVSLSLYLLSTLINFAFFLIDLKLKPKKLEIIYSFLTIFVPVIVVFFVMFIVGYKNLFCEKDNFIFINTFSILAKRGTEKTLVLWNEIFDVQNNRERYALENPTVEKHKFNI